METKVTSKNREVIDSFIHLLSEPGRLSQENSYSQEYIYYHILRFRSRILSEKLRQRGYSLSQFNFQTLPCLKLHSIDRAEEETLPSSSCRVLKTLHPIPTPIHIKSVMSVAGNIHFDFIEWERIEDFLNSRFKPEREKMYYSLKNTGQGTYMYIFNSSSLEAVSLTAIFEDPLLVYRYPDCENNIKYCFSPLEESFILDPDLLPLVYDLAYGSLFRAQNRATDVMDNKHDDITTTQFPVK